MCRSTLALLGIVLVLAACSGRGAQTDSASSAASRGAATGNTLIAYNAGSLARPLRAALDSFTTPRGITIEQENAGSLETARKLTDLHKIPDIVALADYEVFPELLMPSQLTWYVQFARNRMVLAYTDKSRFANEINSYRVGLTYFDVNFGSIQIDWEERDPIIRLQVRDEKGDVVLQQRVLLSQLRPAGTKR